jgi:hypothetical protein
MKYIKPAVEISEPQVVQMLAESLLISSETVDGSKALTKEDDAWDIWGED